MTLQQLQYFLAAVEHGSFSAAADAQHMAQPSLSEQVRRLEAELGVELFARVGRGLALTEAGHTLRPHAERVVADAQEARDSVIGVRELRGGTVSLGMFGDAPYYLLTEVIEEFRDRHPDVRVRVVGQNSSEVADALRAGDLEAAVIALPVDDTGLEVRPIMDVEIFFATSVAERLPRRMTVKRLAELPLIVYDANYGWEDPTRRQLDERAQRAGVSLDPVVEIEDVMAAVQLAGRGVGDTVVSQAVATGSRFPRNLLLAPFDPPLRDTFAIVTRRGAHLSPAVTELLSLAEREMSTFAERVAAQRSVAIVFSMSEDHATEAEEEYLQVLFWLYEAELTMTAANVARAMQLSAPSVHEMVGRLERDGYIARDEDKIIRFTEHGREHAEQIVSRHRLIERFLTDVVGVPWDDVHEEAEKLEHAMSPRFEAYVRSSVSDATTCPHGHPIVPGRRIEGVPLADVQEGAKVTILRFENEAEDLLHYLKSAGLEPGLVGTVARVGDEEVVVTGDDAEHAVTTSVAETVSVIADPSPPPRTALPDQLVLGRDRYGR